MQKIPWSYPEIRGEELNEVLDSFRADWLTMGPKVAKFEHAMAQYLQVPYAVAVSNGTAALDLALKALGIGPGDEIIVPALTYIATPAAVSYQSAIPVFVDIEPQSFNLDPKKVESAIGPKTKAIIFIDYGGNPADIKQLQSLAQRHGLILLQDAAQSLGGIYAGRPLGAQTMISTMSFHMAKVMTTVEGGMIFTHDADIAKELKIRRNQGESGKYLHSHLGTNARMTDLAAAIGLAQVKKLLWMLEERQRVAQRYNSHFSSCDEIEVIRCQRPDSRNAYFFYPILVENRDAVAEHLKTKGIDTRIAYPMPVYEQGLYRSGRTLCRITGCSVAKRFTSRVINLPIYPSLLDEQVDWIAAEVLNALSNTEVLEVVE
ncbi:DegT/DnrJ/EryC1/StrS family aminotransferase [Candidatus Omnitrophota bacterium]